MKTVFAHSLQARLLVPALASALLAACAKDDPDPTPVDTGLDAADAGGDTTPDATPDAEPDATPDTALDVTDAAPDAVEDVAPDAADVFPDATPDLCSTACNAMAACAEDAGCTTEPFDLGAICRARCAADPVAFGAWVEDECRLAASVIALAAGDGDSCLPETCVRPTSDYTPGADDEWPACVADSGTWTRIEENVSTIPRIAAYEAIADLLWRAAGVPDGEAFISARTEYSIDEGLESRVLRREDEHYPPAVNGEGATASCRDAGIPELNPDRCAGPAKISPVLLAAFQGGIRGENPTINAARIDAGLLWFLHLSTFKEARTCAVTKRDCDSAWAYYGGGEERDGGLGLAAAIRDVSELAHNYVYDGLLGVRCWRDLDPDAAATDLALRDRAVTQMDRAQHFGVARVVAARLLTDLDESGVSTPEAMAFASVLYRGLEREAGLIDGAAAGRIAAALGGAPLDGLGQLAVASDLLATFACP